MLDAIGTPDGSWRGRGLAAFLWLRFFKQIGQAWPIFFGGTQLGQFHMLIDMSCMGAVEVDFC